MFTLGDVVEVVVFVVVSSLLLRERSLARAIDCPRAIDRDVRCFVVLQYQYFLLLCIFSGRWKDCTFLIYIKVRVVDKFIFLQFQFFL